MQPRKPREILTAADVPSAAKSRAMARVRPRDTEPELIVRSLLHRAGFRFRTHARELSGTPDIVLPRHRLAIFVHGCFWHGHEGCSRAGIPKTRTDFWASKIARNIERDRTATSSLAKGGWRTLVIWTCETTSAATLTERLREVLDFNLPSEVQERLKLSHLRRSRRL